jgi:hypothetical protein
VSVTQIAVGGSLVGVTAEVVASLPMSYAFSDGNAQVIVIDGSAAWPVRAAGAVTGGARGVIVTDPVAVDPFAIASLAKSASVSRVAVLLSEPWAGNPTALAIAPEWRTGLTSASTIESTAIVSAHGAANVDLVLRQLRLLRRLGVNGIALRTGNDTSDAYSRLGSADGGGRVILFGVRSSGSEESLDVVVTTPAQTISLRMTSARSARPASAVRLTPSGGEIFPTIYETAHRATFVLMHELLVSGSTVDELAGFAEDVTAAQGALHES